jgi:hypothetical protein
VTIGGLPTGDDSIRGNMEISLFNTYRIVLTNLTFAGSPTDPLKHARRNATLAPRCAPASASRPRRPAWSVGRHRRAAFGAGD